MWMQERLYCLERVERLVFNLDEIACRERELRVGTAPLLSQFGDTMHGKDNACMGNTLYICPGGERHSWEIRCTWFIYVYTLSITMRAFTVIR